MLSGVEDINSGEAWINDASVNTELAEARKLLGLCPQFDALMANLTAREHLKIFAMIRGVPADIAPDLIDRTITDMDLTLKADERTSGYSGGNKRKLSVALSMVANPTVNFLDEPSTGMDPETRRFMWNYIASVREGRALVLTTHSMEEADALCSKIGIMIRGQLRALGSSQQLKSQYGEGFQCMIRLGEVSFNLACVCVCVCVCVRARARARARWLLASASTLSTRPNPLASFCIPSPCLLLVACCLCRPYCTHYPHAALPFLNMCVSTSPTGEGRSCCWWRFTVQRGRPNDEWAV